MTTAKAMLVLPSFRDGVAHILDLALEHGGLLGQSLHRGIPERPANLTNDDWRRAVSTFRLLWEIGSREGKDAVIEEIDQAFPEAGRESISALSKLLESNALIESKIRGLRRRDGFLPIVTESRISLDLRVLEQDSDDDPMLVAPVVTVRLEFDETVGGSEAIVFQLPYAQLDELRAQLEHIAKRFREVPRILALADVPEWSLEGTEK